MSSRLITGFVFVGLLAACDQAKSTAPADPATTPPPSATVAPKQAQPGASAQTEGASAPATSTGTTVQNGDKKVVVDTGPNGTQLNVQNDAGKGAVKVNPGGGAAITGKDGKTIVIPGGGSLPMAK